MVFAQFNVCFHFWCWKEWLILFNSLKKGFCFYLLPSFFWGVLNVVHVVHVLQAKWLSNYWKRNWPHQFPHPTQVKTKHHTRKRMEIKPFSFLLSLHETKGSPKLHVNQDQTLGCVCSRQAHLLLLQVKTQPKSNR